MTGWTTLDYPKAQITIRGVSAWESKFRAKACEKEPWCVAWIESIPEGSVFWDIGANTAPYALIAGARGILTFAFEPGYANYSAAQDNRLANPASASLITVLPIALGDVTSLVPFFYRNLEPGAASHSFGDTKEKMVAQAPAVAVRADEFINVFHVPPPTHLKIDVDGAEARVLAGFGQAIQTVQSIMIEVPNKGDQVDLIHQLLTNGGLKHVVSHNQRDGHTIGDIHYETWVRS